MTTDRNIAMHHGVIVVLQLPYQLRQRYLVALPENTTINEIKVDGYSKGSRSTGAIIGCN